ncbi:hypothetical protein [Mariprofundus micogutta]|nr:hypothetical protein [Mariprofundus micogutta]
MQQHGYNNPKQQRMADAEALSVVLSQAIALAPADQIRGWISHRMRTSQKPDRREIRSLDPDELGVQLEDIRRIKKLGVKRKYLHAKLNPYRAEILELHRQAASLAAIRDWLRRYRRVSADRSTIFRSIKRWEKEGELHS